jgi:hypothetical protein
MFSTSSSEPTATAEHPHPNTARRHGPGRPFQPGTSGNPAGQRTKTVDVGELARRYARRAVQALVRQLSSSDPQAAVAAAEVLLAHGYGDPIQHVALHVPRISIVCHASEPEPARPNGEARAWDA